MSSTASKGHFAQTWLSGADAGDGEGGNGGDATRSSHHKTVVSTLRQAHQMYTARLNNVVSLNEERTLLSAINSRAPCCFLTVVGDNPGISVVHHLANYSTHFRAVGPLEGRVLGFLGDILRQGESIIPMLVKAPANNTSKVLFGVTKMRKSVVADIQQMQDFYEENDDFSMLVPPSYAAQSRVRNTNAGKPQAVCSSGVALVAKKKKEEEMDDILDDDDGVPVPHQPRPHVSETLNLPSLMLIPTPWAPYFLRNNTSESLSPFAALKIAESLIETQLSDERHRRFAKESLLIWLRAACMARSDDPNDSCTSCMSVAWEPILSISQDLQQWAREKMHKTLGSMSRPGRRPAAAEQQNNGGNGRHQPHALDERNGRANHLHIRGAPPTVIEVAVHAHPVEADREDGGMTDASLVSPHSRDTEFNGEAQKEDKRSCDASSGAQTRNSFIAVMDVPPQTSNACKWCGI
jgi:hypothetical protein